MPLQGHHFLRPVAQKKYDSCGQGRREIQSPGQWASAGTRGVDSEGDWGIHFERFALLHGGSHHGGLQMTRKGPCECEEWCAWAWEPLGQSDASGSFRRGGDPQTHGARLSPPARLPCP